MQSASFRSDEIDQMLIDFVFALRRHRRYQGAAFVVAIEGNMSYIEADRIASIVQKSQVQPVVVLAEDGQHKGRFGVHTGHMEKSAYIEVIQALMVRGGMYWAAPCDFVGRYNRGAEQLSASILTAQRTEFQTTMYGEMMNYRSERRDPKVCCAAIRVAAIAAAAASGGRMGPGQGGDLRQGTGPERRHVHVAADCNLLGAVQDRGRQIHGHVRTERLVESRRRTPDSRRHTQSARCQTSQELRDLGPNTTPPVWNKRVHVKHADACGHDAIGFMKIVTWNLCANEFLVDDVSTTVPPHQVADALDREARCLRMLAALETHLDADVLFLQEVMPDECKRICAMFQHHSATVGPSLSWYGSNQWRSSNVTLIRKPLANEDVVRTALDGSVFTERWYHVIDGAQINTSTDDSYAIANVHLDDRQPTLRLRQLHGILNMTAKFRTCIIGGDFNEACRESSELNAALAAHGFKTLCSADTITYTGSDGHDSIDQIAVRGYDRAFDLQCRDYNAAHFTSDHLLLSAVAISSDK